MLEYFLLSNMKTGSFLYDTLLIIFILPFLTYLTQYVKNNSYKMLDFSFLENIKSYKEIKLEGTISLCHGFTATTYPYPMIAVCSYIIRNNLINKIKYFNTSINNNFTFKNSITNNNFEYIISAGKNVKIYDDIYFDYSETPFYQNDETSIYSHKDVCVTLKSKYKSIDELKKFVKMCINEYIMVEKERDKNKLYHFIYQSCTLGEKNIAKLNFSKNIFSNFDIINETNFETFNTLFSDNKNTIIKSIDKLNDFEYYKRTGIRRKKGFLFYGPPGTGKTSHVIAMANHTKRHIIEIPMSRIKTNLELEMILNLNVIDGVSFDKNEIIIIFDEIDYNDNLFSTKNDIDSKDSKDSKEITPIIINHDKVNIGNFLSRLDGIGNYNGLIIVATTNNKEKLPEALCRDGRLQPLYFNYCNKNNLIDMIEYYYNVKLTEDEKSNIPNIDKLNISHSTIRKYIEMYENNLYELINYLNTL